MSAVLADTHTIVWYLATPARLSANAVQALALSLACWCADLCGNDVGR